MRTAPWSLLSSAEATRWLEKRRIVEVDVTLRRREELDGGTTYKQRDYMEGLDGCAQYLWPMQVLKAYRYA
jgi:hypothetical protein